MCTTGPRMQSHLVVGVQVYAFQDAISGQRFLSGLSAEEKMDPYSISPSFGQLWPFVQMAGHTCSRRLLMELQGSRYWTHRTTKRHVDNIRNPNCPNRIGFLRRDTNLPTQIRR